MMSLSQLSQNVAQAIGNGLSGLLLVAFDQGHKGVLGVSAIVVSLIFHLFTIDPTQKRRDE
jgi:predicted MFS family arabinose efflux permease